MNKEEDEIQRAIFCADNAEVNSTEFLWESWVDGVIQDVFSLALLDCSALGDEPGKSVGLWVGVDGSIGRGLIHFIGDLGIDKGEEYHTTDSPGALISMY